MSGKRLASVSQATSSKDEPPSKKPFVAIPPVNIGSVATEVRPNQHILAFRLLVLFS